MLRFGLIKVILISRLLNGAGLIITVFAYEEWQLLVSVGVCLGIASGIIGLVLASTIAIRWFNLIKQIPLKIALLFNLTRSIYMPFLSSQEIKILFTLIRSMLDLHHMVREFSME